MEGGCTRPNSVKPLSELAYCVLGAETCVIITLGEVGDEGENVDMYVVLPSVFCDISDRFRR